MRHSKPRSESSKGGLVEPRSQGVHSRAFEGMGYRVGASETSFLMVDICRAATEFQAACRPHGVLAGRPFPPLTTCARVSIGTPDEMRQAVAVFRNVLGAASTTAACP